jgi:hypothetical protein
MRMDMFHRKEFMLSVRSNLTEVRVCWAEVFCRIIWLE